MTRIEADAFWDWYDYKSLKTVYYKDSWIRWGKIKIDYGNDPLDTAKKVFGINAAPVISNKTLSLHFNNTKRLTLKGAGKSVKWTSSNTKIASVTSSGTVKARRKGSCVITAATNGSKVTCKVTVTGAKKVTKVTCSKEMTMRIGTSETFEYTVLPDNASNKKVKITTSNPSVVQVSSGKLIAKKIGKARITVQAADGSGKKAACTVTVVKRTKCGSCNGTGECSLCDGTGRCKYCNGRGYWISSAGRYHECVICLGDGKCDLCYGRGRCWICDGKGWR